MIVNTATSPASTLKDAMAKCQVIPFGNDVKLIMKSKKAFDAVAEKSAQTVKRVMQHYVDQNRLANGASEASCKVMHSAIMECEEVNNTVALGTMERETWKNYSASAQRALYWNIPFEPTLFQKNGGKTKSGDEAPNYQLPWSPKAKSKNGTTNAGPVQSTSREALDATLSKAIQQARLLGLTEFSATLLDHCLDALEGFKEIEAK